MDFKTCVLVNDINISFLSCQSYSSCYYVSVMSRGFPTCVAMVIVMVSIATTLSHLGLFVHLV